MTPRCPGCPVEVDGDCHIPAALCRKVTMEPDRWRDAILAHEARWKASQTRDLPSIATQAAHLASAVAHHLAGGMRRATPEEREARQAICRACEHFRPSDKRCGICGCNVPTKAAWLSSACPISKW